MARALVLDPEIIFADEPTGNLDSHTSAEVLGLMRKVVQEKNQTMVMVTHDNHLAGFADRIFHIIDGKIVKIETRSCLLYTSPDSAPGFYSRLSLRFPKKKRMPNRQ